VLIQHERVRTIGLGPANRAVVHMTFPASPAEQAGLQKGDEVIAVNGKPIFSRSALGEAIDAAPEAALALTIRASNGSERLVNLTPESVVIDTAGNRQPMIGVQWARNYETIHRNPFTQIYDAYSLTLTVLGALIHPASDVGVRNLSGPVGIGYSLYLFSQIGLLDLLSIVLLININLAILNLLPIPILDGGHMAFATIGKLRGRPLPGSLIASLQSGFALLLLGTMLYVTFFDVGRVDRNEREIRQAEQQAAQRIQPVFGQSESPSVEPAT